ncbi:lipase 3-like isoform X2 [Diabrotica virgifera virgifera]|uniref:Lipase n=1 Tax=Diabrotica virgifera virgifera TaxID=50390 RepID=A0ABM5KVS8_DIAVI|nr:lipase 3-like isoform X2 [Diabrotica virgifera virgifera]XP_050514296.1 lipase 3-like isoform X2 [Diabrotica virgifera virgifera]XP_050514297.1 lipase 3-like isoform X2 [Diabrotica virgifera virgifera]
MKSAVLILAVIAATRANVFDSIADLTKMTADTGTDALEAIEKVGEGTLAAVIPERADRLKVQRKTIEELVGKEGYAVESHHVTTEDGYILTLYRIPRGKSDQAPSKVVLLQHGVLASCTDWILFGKERGLAFILADLGFDVWLANCRGNYYSRNHIKLNPDKDPEFWAFSWHEIGMYDVPAMIDYMLKVTGEKQIYHVGHSQGTTTFYVMTSMRPEYNDKIIHHISLAPTGFMNHLQSPLIQLFAGSTESLGALMKVMGQYEFMPEDSFLNFATAIYCSNTGLNKIICKNALFLMSGFNDKQMSTKEIPIIRAYYPAGAATRQLVHYGQEIKSHRFCRYDFGLLKNNKIYMGRLTPPDYELEKIRASITLIFSKNDWMSSPKDVERLAKGLVNANVVKIEAPLENCNHLDYLFGKDAPKTIYPLVAKILTEN